MITKINLFIDFQSKVLKSNIYIYAIIEFIEKLLKTTQNINIDGVYNQIIKIDNSNISDYYNIIGDILINQFNIKNKNVINAIIRDIFIYISENFKNNDDFQIFYKKFKNIKKSKIIFDINE